MSKKQEKATANGAKVSSPASVAENPPVSAPERITVGGGVAEPVAFDPTQMDAAAALAKQALQGILQNPEAKPMDILRWYRDPAYGYMKSGHKRLGRMMAELGKSGG